MNLRYAIAYPETREVPGQSVNRRQQPTPLNCRRLLRAPPGGPAEPATLPIPAALRLGAGLFPWQARAVRWLLPRAGGNLWHAPGAGKSYAALYAALCYGGPIVWVTLANLRPTVRREVRQRCTLEPLVLEGKSSQAIPSAAKIIIIGWETLSSWLPELERYLKQGTVIFDEIHKAKQWKRKEKGVDVVTGKVTYSDMDNISASAARLARAAQHRIGLTATPVANLLSDLWSQLDIIEPDCYGDNWSFVHRYCDAKKGEYGGLDTSGKSNLDELNARLKESTHVVKKSELMATLPACRRNLVYLSKAEQCRPQVITKADMALAARSGKQALFELQLQEAASRKRKWVVDYVIERLRGGQKVVMFSARKLDVDALQEALAEACTKVGIQAPLWHGHSGVSSEERQRMCEDYFGYKGACCLIGTGDSYGVGRNLQDTDVAIFVMLPYTPMAIEQWEGRFARPGQLRPVEILYVIAEGTTDEHVADLLLEKLESVVEAIDDESASTVAETLAGDMNQEAIMKSLLEKI